MLADGSTKKLPMTHAPKMPVSKIVRCKAFLHHQNKANTT